ncbi:MAG TPA: LLM class F420-dependent oxidoreductase [Terriglobales bacterium]|nr:LLM class F420-dependent oxidoreductase [Terriglobales bacterium]
MRFGLFSINAYAAAEPRTLARVARAAEAAGFDSLWGGEHVVLPDPQAPPSPMAPTDHILDPLIALTYAAAVTTRVNLGTGIIILPQRNPVVLAKELASLDVLSGGRLIVGIGVGYLEPEFRAIGAPFEDRGAVTDEYLGAMRVLWSAAKPAYRGRFVSFGDIQAHPQPVQRPHPPVVVGGRSAPAFRRAVQYGNGWYGFGMNVDATKRALDGLRAAAGRGARPAELGELDISITPGRRVPVDRATAEDYAALGVHRLILMPPASLDADGLERYVETVGKELIA